MNNNVAIIDLGTNTFHLKIVDIEKNEVLTRFKYPVKIGEGGINKKTITPKAENRALEALIFFKSVINEYGANEIFAFATSAFRNADNAQEIIKKIYDSTYINVKVISGEKEAELIYKGVKQAVNINSKVVVMDIGGGSVEFVIGNKHEIFWKKSYEIGAQRLYERFHKTDPIANDELNDLFEYLDTSLTDLWRQIEVHKPTKLIGSSGTYDTLSEITIHRKNEQIIYEKQKSYELTINDFNLAYSEIVKSDRNQRLKIPGMVEMRVDMIVVSSSLVHLFLKKTGINEIIVSNFALKEGILNEILLNQNYKNE